MSQLSPPFLFHYIIVIVCLIFIMCVGVLKFKYLYWYNQPITFRFTIRRWFRDGGGATGRNRNTGIMNPLSLAERCNNAVVYPFLHFVSHENVRVYGSVGVGVGVGTLSPISDAPYERIAAFLSRRPTEITIPSFSGKKLHIPSDILELILSQETHGLSAFIGVLINDEGDNTPVMKGDNTPVMKGDNTPVMKGDNTPVMKGVCVLTPRIMLSFSGSTSSSAVAPTMSVSIYVCDYIAWERYITSERESLTLLETTEYIQKSREIAGEQTLYRYSEIPWFVVPFTTVYTYTFASVSIRSPDIPSLGGSISMIQVSVANFAMFYAFVNECTRDFRCCIMNELTQLQSLIQNGVYHIYMLLLNQVRVIAVYIYAPSWMKINENIQLNVPKVSSYKQKPKKTNGNRISALHHHISRTSTAVVKYLPPVHCPKYDAFGKRIKDGNHYAQQTDDKAIGGGGGDILRLISSIQHKSLCDSTAFMYGYYSSVSLSLATNNRKQHNTTVVCIDTLAHNYRIIDSLISSAAGTWKLLSREKWYYILYNAIIHQETMCKDILMI